MPTNNMTIFSFFSGCGFLDLGFEYSKFHIDFVNEFSAPFLAAYKFSRSQLGLSTPRYGYWNTDINEYLSTRNEELHSYLSDSRKRNSLVGFIGGPPCPDFSVGGKNKGRNGENGKLSLTYINLLLDMNPDFFLFENVKGLWRTALHREFYNELKEKLHTGKFCTTERLTNSLEFGVPQDRDRILLFGVKKQLLGEKQYLGDEIIDFPWASKAIYPIDTIKKFDWPRQNSFHEESHLPSSSSKMNELTVQHWFDKNSVETHFNANAFFKPRCGLSKMQTIAEGDVSKKSFKRLHRWRYSPTAAYGNNEVHLHPYKARRISVSEALAIQSLPKDFKLPSDMSLSSMFKTIGNGVPFLLAKGIAETIHAYMFSLNHD